MGIGISRGRKVHAAATVISGVAALLLGLAVGQAGGGQSPEAAGTPRSLAGVEVGFADSPDGAAKAVAAYQSAFATPEILRPGALKRRVQVVATPAYAARMLAANSPGEQRIAAGPIGVGVRAELQTLYASVPVGYRVQSYSPGRARVLTWGFTLLGNADSVEPEAYFGLAKTELVWEGHWRIAAVHSGFGPTPQIETGRSEVGGYDLIALARGLKSYAGAP
jgi:hypothetical protein